MSQRTVARRYASALQQEARSEGVLDAVDADVDLLRTSLQENRELERFFKSPVIPREKKDDVLTALLEDRLHALTLRFLRLLVSKDRETITEDVLEAYHELRDEQRGIVDVHARVARPMADEDREALTGALEAQTGKTVRLHVEEEPDLLGGIVIRIGDRVFDGSVRNKLSNLHERLRDTRLASAEPGANGRSAG
jgi:F-type H+-transporting ATPase subunit delta